MPKARLPELQRFMSFVEIPKESGCWLWMAQKDKCGYGHFKSNLRDWLAHRWSYEYFRGDLKSHLTIDHLFRRVACVNPFHLEQVTNKENVRRQKAEGR